MRLVGAALCAFGLGGTVAAAEPSQVCGPPAATLDAFVSLLDTEWWRLSPKDLDPLWLHRLRDTGCGTVEGRCLDRTWCGRSPDRPDECACLDQFSFTGPKGGLKLVYFDVNLEVEEVDTVETALGLRDAIEASGRANEVACSDLLQHAVACYEWPIDTLDQTVAISIWVSGLGPRRSVSAEAYVSVREP